ncbi:rCG31942 [Rattus norvegicus]|uniref:RCG31942 n=1 Tax=Rattus norvegicus TaxID=10116 RepID=A6KDQ2_RAT|nr:rCG31942 [Rattus norvegicus]
MKNWLLFRQGSNQILYIIVFSTESVLPSL